MALEKVVRPYQLRTTTPPVVLEVASNVDAQPVTVKIGLGGQGKIMQGSFSSSETTYQDKAAVEKSF